ncbi:MULTISPECIES: HNH endonuclease signature motif containing protein [unclassified Mycolicibacterium]|uniref:HNH endonuclease signature motif containing protein n=1 Tax=unclassified Mycolicibacterium TaxID=2636767 RepID=UPI0012DFAA5C|nr:MULTISPECIES: HNH endonuclease signature motif containing protein [unclassified Mycolicibacterium]MUL81104.1 HNH endonuclease [Mycolicibacterium sp. CBMA 329]MUL86870.1 HNH endonuclease [Mycolicibacterium sp. CBMA 331]MUL98845.1 HNH endonuclease [Mycolicibacterium sp. CBMA 334]MUM28895.1 HNH endonuclease [Mycolicibacterium sp. CBMA 295]MUM37167.1 HNH endonuclease [Mycolicibacterium sp. CBMA 247]
MFDTDSDADLIDRISVAARAESTAIAGRLAAIGELDTRRERELAETIFWTTDPFEEVAAEVSAALNISRGRAGWQIRQARVLRDRLPKVAAVFATGAIDARLVTTIINRTEIVRSESLAALDETLSRRAPKWMRLSRQKLQDRVDQTVAKLDPNGVRVPPVVDEGRHLTVEPGSTPGTALIWGVVTAADGAAIDQRLDALAATVCENDPRTLDQRRSDACGPLARLEAQLSCQCGLPDCPATQNRAAATAAVIHVLAEHATLDEDGPAPGYLPGYGILPAESVRNLASSAKRKPLTVPVSVSENTANKAEPGYRPSVALSEFIRWRDLTCCFPGCDAPAAGSDIDHTVPYPLGPTHPSNTKLLCRAHHLVKTFCPGWTDRQLPDGTVEFTSPTGHTYTTEPHGAAMFPTLAQSTGELTFPEPQAPSPNRGVMMPTRRQTREQDRQDRIAEERRLRAEINTDLEVERQYQAWLTDCAEPPPF